MRDRSSARVVTLAVTVAASVAALAPPAVSQEPAVQERFYAETLHPVLHAAQCVRCHNTSGVASETRLAFPPDDADKTQLTGFGLSLIELIDRKNPGESLLLQKPTRRVKHTGGQRIKPGSEAEQLLVKWVNYLAN